MGSAKTVDLMKEQRDLKRARPGLVDSYKDFIDSFSEYRRLEEHLKLHRDRKTPDPQHLPRPAAITGSKDD